MAKLTPERLLELLAYDSESGLLLWKRRPDLLGRASAWNTRFAGTTAGTVNSRGYLQVRVEGVVVHAHRIIYAMVTGVDPGKMHVDHANTNRLDNRFENLRLLSNAENQYNKRGARAGCASGYRGVTLHKPSGLWVAKVTKGGVTHFHKYFRSVSEANEAVIAARKLIFGGLSNG